MKYIYLAIVVCLLGGCVVAPPVKEEVIEKPNGQVVEKDIVEEPYVEPVVGPIVEPFFGVDPVIDVPVGGVVRERGVVRGGFGGHFGGRR